MAGLVALFALSSVLAWVFAGVALFHSRRWEALYREQAALYDQCSENRDQWMDLAKRRGALLESLLYQRQQPVRGQPVGEA